MCCVTTLYCYAWVSFKVPHFLREMLVTCQWNWREMRHRIVPVHDPRPIRDVCIEPLRELLVSDPRGPECIKLTDFVLLSLKVRDCKSCQRSTQANACDMYRFLVVVRAVITNELINLALNFLVVIVEAFMNAAIVAERVICLGELQVLFPLFFVNSAPKHEYYGIQIRVFSNEAGDISLITSGKVCDVLDVGVGFAYGAVPVRHILLWSVCCTSQPTER